MRATLRFFTLAVMLPAALLLAACSGNEHETRVPVSVRNEKSRPPVEEPPVELLATQQAFTAVAGKVTPAVVNISAARTVTRRSLDPFFEEFFGDFFHGQPRAERKEQSLGSGFIISSDGYILTNEHVVKGAEEIKVKLSDQRIYPGRVIGVDPRTDVAVLKIDGKERFTPAVLGNSDQLQVGQWALAIGNPFGLDRTVTVGVISATGRANVGIEDYEDFIQTDASINPGNSGGPLLNVYGEVIGINTAIVASGQGIGFAIPINLAQPIARQLMEKGEVTRGWLGVSIQPLTPELAESFGLDRVGGALVNQVIEGSPADKAGLQRGDVLLTFAGKEVRGVRELQLLVASTPVGQQAEIEILRAGKRLSLSVTMAAQEKPSAMSRPSREPPQDEGGEILGIRVLPNQDGGVLVAQVDPQSAAAVAGLRAGDIVLAVNRTEIDSPGSFTQAMRQAARSGKNVTLLLRRGENTLYIAFPAR